MNKMEGDSVKARLIAQGCTCPFEWKALGFLYKVSMGKGWVRMVDAPDCPLHKREREHGGLNIGGVEA